MESVGRTIAGIAPWLELGPDKTAEGKLRDKYIKMVCKGLKNSVDPHADDYFNSTATRQILVNSAFLIQGLLQAPTQLWGNLDDKTQQRLIEQWKSTRTMKPGNNNWLLFSAMVECGLKSFGNEWNFEVIEKAISSHEQWYKGDGVYGDGENFHLDYYNSYVIHPMLLQVLKVVVKYDSSYQILLDKEWKRFVRYAEIQERMIAPDGSYPVLGRSVSYRSAAFQVLGASALFHQLPSSLKAGQVRGAMTAMLKRLFEQPGTFDKNGWLTIGVCGEQPELGDSYLSTPCVYLCSLGFLPLGLPADDVFWTAPLSPWTSIKAFSGEEFPIDKFMKPYQYTIESMKKEYFYLYIVLINKFMWLFTKSIRFGGSYYWITVLTKIADPVLENMSKGELKKNMPVETISGALNPPNTRTTHLEALGRLLVGMAPWLELGPDETEEGRFRSKYIRLMLLSIDNGFKSRVS